MNETETAQLAELIAWKQRIEVQQAERLRGMYNDLIDMFVKNSATISEVLTVLRMAELNATHGFLNKQLNPDSIAQAALQTIKR